MNGKKRELEKGRLFIIAAFLPFAFLLFTCLSMAQTLAPGAPGKDAQWASAGKQGVGTSATLESKVWFTLQGGALTEVYYPDVTVANVHLLQFVVVNPKTKKVETEREDAVHDIKVLRPDSLTFQQINTAKSGEWKITKTYVTDPEQNTLVVKVEIEHQGREIYVYFDPSIKNSGMHDTAWYDERQKAFLSKDNNIASALIFDFVTITNPNNGFLGVNDGLTLLKQQKNSTKFSKAEDGNVIQSAGISAGIALKLKNGKATGEEFHFALGFGSSEQQALNEAKNSLAKGFEKVRAEYEKGWTDYVKTLRKVEPKYQAQFNMAAMILKAHEDKTHRGANIASLTVPWGGAENANEANVGGYHLVWSRDLYQVATAFMALGDRDAAMRALDFLFKIQQKPDGSFPQNSWLDGKPFWNSLQLDEVAFPLILAYQLGRNDKETWENHVKKAADFLVRTGPKTPQERWEEESGYSPSTIAAEIAGLICAAEIARQNKDEASALIYLAAADDWARKVEMWTATTTGKYGDGNYYLRITQNGAPDAGEKIELNNGAGFFDEREIVDAGFLELVRLGIKPADDPLIAKSVKVIDQIIKVNTPNGDAFYRYNNDGYGEMDDGRRWNWDGKYTGKGRLWALLSGERGQYELALANAEHNKLNQIVFKTLGAGINLHKERQFAESFRNSAKSRLESMINFANEGLMIPEQIWDKLEVPRADSQFSPNLKFGEGTGSATPLAWSMAQFIRLAVNLQEGRNLETPDVVYNRYKNGIPSQVSEFGGLDQEIFLPFKSGETVKVPRRAQPKTKIAYELKGKTKFIEADEKGQAIIEFEMPAEDSIGILGIQAPDGATSFERVKLLVKPKTREFSAELIEKIKAAKQSPFAEGGKAILFYRGAANAVQVAGDMTSWNDGQIFMQPIAENLYAAQIEMPATARFEYKLVVDGKWIEDPLNERVLDNGGGGKNNFFAMPGYRATEWDDAKIKPLVKPITELEIGSKKFGKRTVKIYLPSEYYKRGVAPKMSVLYLQDGSSYISQAKAIEVLENLVEAQKVEPFILVFIDPKDRNREYWANDDWADFVALEVVPAVEAKFSHVVKTGRENRAAIGASLGGITSLWIGLKHPDKFARLGGQSSSFWVDNERVVKALAALDPQKISYTFYLDDGFLEGSEDSRRVNVMLRAKGYPVTYREEVTGHNWTSWRDRLADAFVALWK